MRLARRAALCVGALILALTAVDLGCKAAVIWLLNRDAGLR